MTSQDALFYNRDDISLEFFKPGGSLDASIKKTVVHGFYF
jgi:hypothetical protein